MKCDTMACGGHLGVFCSQEECARVPVSRVTITVAVTITVNDDNDDDLAVTVTVTVTSYCHDFSIGSRIPHRRERSDLQKLVRGREAAGSHHHRDARSL